MKYYLIILLIFISKILNAQTIEEQKMFLKTISNHNENRIIPYVPINYVNNYNILNYKLIRKKLGLTKKQSKFIIRKSKTQTFPLKVNFSQIDSFAFIKLKQEDIFNYLQQIKIEKSEKRRYFHDQNDIESMKKLDQNLYHYVYSFGMPVYFDNNQSCLIESVEYCGGCGVTKLSVFNIKNGIWELSTSEITGDF